MSDQPKQPDLFGDFPSPAPPSAPPPPSPKGADAGTCRGCGARVWWVVIATNRAHPVDFVAVRVWCDWAGKWEKGWRSHFDTCPDAAKFRGGKKR